MAPFPPPTSLAHTHARGNVDDEMAPRAFSLLPFLGLALAALNCTNDMDCIPLGERCLPDPAGSPCVLDYAYNETGTCACKTQACVLPTYPAALPGTKQWLVAGDSISLGQLASLSRIAGAGWQVLHVNGNYNCDNALNAAKCFLGWLGTNASRWDVITYNSGAHDLAFPDNEHLVIPTFAGFVTDSLSQLARTVRADTRLMWMRITPVPTDPAPECVLIPGRLEKDVIAYNVAADAVVQATGGRVGSCDLHKVITDYCGVGYSNCSITQCAGPHFTPEGFTMLAQKAVECVAAA